MLLLFACSAENEPSDIDIFKTSTCNLPCWNGIKTGQTTEDELLRILNNLPIVNKELIGYNTETGISEKRYSLRLGKADLNGQYQSLAFINIKDGKVLDMVFVGGFDLTLDKALSMFGKPENVFTVHDHNGNIDFTLFIPKAGVIATITKAPNNPIISGKEKIVFIEFVDPNLYDEIIQIRYTVDGRLLLYQWNGFGVVLEKYPP